MGHTSTILSPGSTSPSIIVFSPLCSNRPFVMNATSISTASRCSWGSIIQHENSTTSHPYIFVRSPATPQSSGTMSDWLCTTTTGTSFSLNCISRSFSSFPKKLPANTRIARSTSSTNFRVFPILWAPTWVVSPTPAVSINCTGPMPGISILFFTGSVVVPACSETIAKSCPRSRFMRELFPTFVLPKIPICFTFIL